jgi:C4-dicarboxylate-specific signal transduction histidine kinase
MPLSFPAAPTDPRPGRRALGLSAGLLALAIFAVDSFTPLEGAVAVLYVLVVLIAARTGRRRDILTAAGASLALTLIGYVAAHGLHHVGSAVLRAAVSLAAIAIGTGLALQNQAAHAALARSERRYRRMIDASRMGILEEDWTALRETLEREGVAEPAALTALLARRPDLLTDLRRRARIVGINPAFQAMIGAEAAGRPARTVDDVLSPDDRTFPAALAAWVAGAPYFEAETEVSGPGGRPIPVMFSMTFPDAEDGDGAVLVFVVDVTERRQAQDALLHAQSELAHAARVATLGELTASIAHEVNQPLMAAVTNGEAALRWLRREPPDLGEVAANLGRIVSEGRRASEIVARIRAFLKKAPAPHEALAVAPLIEDTRLLVERELARARVSVALEAAPDLPPVSGDRIQIQQILVNLMVNAAQAMAGAAGPRRLTIRATREEAGVTICVADTGPGIAEADLARLFDPFFTTKPSGMGMGLAIARTTAEAHGGRLTAENTGTGATFRLTLPAQDAPASGGTT